MLRTGERHRAGPHPGQATSGRSTPRTSSIGLGGTGRWATPPEIGRLHDTRGAARPLAPTTRTVPGRTATTGTAPGRQPERHPAWRHRQTEQRAAGANRTGARQAPTGRAPGTRDATAEPAPGMTPDSAWNDTDNLGGCRDGATVMTVPQRHGRHLPTAKHPGPNTAPAREGAPNPGAASASATPPARIPGTGHGRPMYRASSEQSRSNSGHTARHRHADSKPAAQHLCSRRGRARPHSPPPLAAVARGAERACGGAEAQYR